jgi:ABC-type transport system substrate-binding protein
VVNETVDPTSYQSLLKAERDFDMTIWVQQDNNNMITALDWTYSCASADLGIGGGNRQGYCNPDVDELQYAASISVDPEERLALVFEAQELLFGDYPEIVLAGQNVMQAYRSDRLDFPVSACDVGDEGLYSIFGLLNAVVK